jgi:hypothetical protein
MKQFTAKEKLKILANLRAAGMSDEEVDYGGYILAADGLLEDPELTYGEGGKKIRAYIKDEQNIKGKQAPVFSRIYEDGSRDIISALQFQNQEVFNYLPQEHKEKIGVKRRTGNPKI